LFSENNLKIFFTWLPEEKGKWPILAGDIYEPQEFSAKTIQSAKQNPTLWQQEVVRYTHVPLKLQNWAYSGLENK